MSANEYRVTGAADANEPVPALVRLDLWGVSAMAVPRALLRMGTDRRAVRYLPGVRFAKLLGTGSGATFTTRDADPRHWAVLTVWDDDTSGRAFEDSRVFRGWSAIAEEHALFELRPLSARGRWAGRQPFGDPVPHRWDGPVAAITRARIRTSQWAAFWRAVPAVSADLDNVGISFRLGIGEAPLGLQGTFSTWVSNAALTEFAHRRSPHTEVMKRTAETGWYAEELFARFALTSAEGTVDGVDVAGTALR